MKKSILLLVFVLICGVSFAQLTGIKTIPGTYASVALAITDLNAVGVGAGGVTFNVAGGYTEILTARLNISATGTSANPIVFQKSGAGANPLLTAYAGTNLMTAATPDGMWSLTGSDYVTIDGIDLQEAATNNTPALDMEYGYGLFKASGTDGANNNSIKNCTITLNRDNNTAPATGPFFQGSNGIVVMDCSPTTATANMAVTTVSGASSNNTFYHNTIQNVNCCIALSGSAAASPYTLADLNNDIGGSAAATGNTLINFGGGAGATNPCAGVFVKDQWSFNVSYNTVNNNNGSGVNHPNINRGIWANSSSIGASATINNNTVTINGGGTTTANYHIDVEVSPSGGAGNSVSISNNSLLNSTFATATSGAFYGIYYATAAATVNVTGNSVTGLSYPGTGTVYIFYNGLAGIGTLNVNNNTINNLTFPSTGTTYMIYNGTTMTNYNINGNTITNITRSGASGTFYGAYTGSPTNFSFSNNTIDGVTFTLVTGTGTVYGIYDISSGVNMTYNNNIIRNIYTPTTGTLYGIREFGTSGIKKITNNQVYNFGTTPGGAGGCTIFGISWLTGATDTVSGNQVYALNSTGTTGGTAGSIQGIICSGGTTNAIFNNKVYNLSSLSTNPVVYGIYITSATNNYVFNNFVSDLRAINANAAIPIAGIYASGGTNDYIYYNTVYLNATSSGALFGTAALYASTTPSVEVRNNIFINTSTAVGATGFTSAYRRSTTTLTTYTNASNNNNFYAGTPGTANLIFYDGTNSDQTLAAYKTRVSPRDGASIAENSPFVNVAATPYDLHMKTNIATQCESGGANIATYTTDIDATIRQGNTGYVGTGTAPDIGADEFNGIPLDITPPLIIYSPLLNTSSFLARTITATITDASGVPVSGAGLPQLYWKKNAGAYANVQAVSIGSGQYTFTFGAGVVLGDVISYYVVAQDNYTPINVGSNPLVGAAGFTASPPAASTPPTTPNAYTIVGTICGTYNVGVGQTYTTLTAAINDLNNKEMTCAVTFLLNDAAYPSEVFPIVINTNGGASAVNTLTIKPKTGVSPLITGSLNASPLIKVFNNYTTIDGSNTVGGTTRDLTVSNTSVTTPNILLLGSIGSAPLLNCTVKNTILINGINSSSGVLVSDGTVAGNAGNFNNIVILNNSIQLAYIGLYCIANPTTGNGSGMVITGNDFSASGANSIRLCPIYVQGIDGVTVSNNTIGNIVNTLDASNETGIWLATSTVNATVSGNTISGMSGSTGAPRGIAVSSGVPAANIVITGNTITNISTASSGSVMGIYFFSTTSGCTISNNQISNIKNSNTGGWLATGMYLASTAVVSANCTVINNAIWDVAGYGYSSYAWNGNGMVIYSGFGYNVYHNTIYMNTDQTVAGIPSALIVYSSITATGAIDLRDNIFANTMTTGTERYTIYSLAANTVFSNIDYNDYYTTGSNLGYIGSNRATLTDLQTGFGGNLNSQSLNPTFVGANLHPTNLALGKKGVYFASVPTDLGGITRTNPPDMGVYEFGTAPAVITLAASPVASTTATLNGSINANTLTTNSFFDYGLTTAYGTSTAGVPVSVTGSSTTPINVPVIGLTPLTTYHFRARGVTSGGLIVYGNDMTFTTTAPPPTVVTVAASGITPVTATLNGTVTANNASTAVTFQYGLTVAYGLTAPGVPATVTGSSVTLVNAPITGLLPNTLYHFRIVGVNTGGTANGLDMTFTTGPVAPTVVTNLASNITTTGAQLNGTVTANSSTAATISFEWGLTTGYGNTIAGIPATTTGNTSVNPLASISSLLTNTTYHYRCVAVNSVGTTYGLDQSFLTGCPAPAPAGPITGPASVCAFSTGKVYSVGTIVNAVSYAWTLPAGATITAGSGTNTITVTFGATSGNVCVAGVGTCGSGTSSCYAVTVNALPVPTIAGPVSACVNSTGNVYTTEAGMTGYTWTVSAGGTITAGGTPTNNTVTVTWATTGAKTVCVNYANASGCTAAAQVCYNVTVNALPTPTITGVSTVCQGVTGNVYTTQAGMTNYVWTVSAGGTITAGGTGTSNTVTVTWTTSGAKTVTVNYTNASGCAAAAPVSFAVTVNPTPLPTIGSTNNPCIGSTNNVYYTESGMTGYAWTVSAGGTIVSGQGTSTLNVTWNIQGAQSVTVTYTSTSGCPATTPGVYNVFVNPPPSAAGAITGTASVCAGTNGVAYSTTPVSGAISYSWTVPSGATIATGAGT
ncbi:MAG: hypothetical protein WCJ26_12650, partial [bacterium]